MIRVRIKNETIRYYVYAYLQSFAGHDQMLKNEYGSVQQHLEAKHISGILIPVPPRWDDVERVTESVREAVRNREALEERLADMTGRTESLLNDLIIGQAKANGKANGKSGR